MGIGAVVMHRFPDGRIKAIAHASKTLTVTEQNYSQVEKEAYALVFAVTKFRRMLLGRKFKLQTDHQPLLKIFGSKKGIPLHTANRLQRWALSLLGFDFEIEYIPTGNFGYVDVLSRLISNHKKPEEEVVIATIGVEHEITATLENSLSALPVNFKMIQQATATDPTLQEAMKLIAVGWPHSSSISDPKLKALYGRRESLSVVNGCIMMEERLVVPGSFGQRILKQIHRGHQGIERMKAIARSIVYWPNIDDDIQAYVRKCSICASAAKSPPHFQPQPWPRAEGPWRRIHLDYAGPLQGLFYLVIVDSYSKWPEIFETRSTTAAVTIRYLMETFARFGVPETIVSDNGSQFSGSEFKTMCQKLGIVHIRTAPYHPQSNGQAERFVDTLKRSLRKIMEGEGVPSTEALQTFLQVYRSTPSAVLDGKSPAQELFCRPMRTTLDLLRPTTQEVPVKKSTSNNFPKDTLVYAKVYNSANKWSWVPGTIIESIGNVNFNVLLSYHHGRKKLIRAHLNQIRPRYDETAQNSKAKWTFDVLVDDFGLKQEVNPEPEVESELSFQSAVADPPIPDAVLPPIQPQVQRPIRNIRLPKRLEDFVVG
ncbi:uncharacterized protein K02A2.6-like [Uranotaenia lowii]|uniref:uncharacterized protein K02A2.6-like n=1 Tax=Uranotaenia lowii TaxID=190385 RepID=UPI00247A7498|nr:uncharacterized protein K02A2.6-like [Uranotaenia lowii]